MIEYPADFTNEELDQAWDEYDVQGALAAGIPIHIIAMRIGIEKYKERFAEENRYPDF